MMDEPEMNETPAPKKTRKKRAVKKQAAPVKKADDRLDGMTVKDCPFACKESKCVITDRPFCGHPRKGGLHSEDMNNATARERRREAEKKLRGQMLDLQ